MFDGSEPISSNASVADFNRDATFENLLMHRWKVQSFFSTISLSSDVVHSGTSSLQILTEDFAGQIQYVQAGLIQYVQVTQTVTVLPRTKYRLTGWIRTDNVLANHESPAASSPLFSSEPGSIGACFFLAGRDDASESIVGMSDWKQVTWEFDTGDSTTLTLGCRLGHNGSTGRAWFDDLVLEKVE